MDISPSVYEHAAFLIGRTPWEVSRDAELIFEAHAAAYRTYRQTPVMPGIDIYNLEPEAYGGVVTSCGRSTRHATGASLCSSTWPGVWPLSFPRR